jgi:ribosomal protein L25 (general stress protein Ctc)
MCSEIYLIEGETRIERGRAAAKQLRDNYRVPATLFGQGKEELLISVKGRTIAKLKDSRGFLGFRYFLVLHITHDAYTLHTTRHAAQRPSDITETEQWGNVDG